jgi:hypothetical protein
VRVNVSQVFENVGAGDVQGSAAAQEAAKLAMSQVTVNNIPPEQISIMSIESVSGRRLLLESSELSEHTEVAHRELATSYTRITFELSANLEEIGFTNKESQRYVSWLKNQVERSVREDTYTARLRAAGLSAGINVFSFVKVSQVPSYSTPLVVFVATYAPSLFVSNIPTAVPSMGLVNLGRCSDSIFYSCMDNMEARDGDFSMCNMCMCKEFRSYGGTRSCAADPVLFACYISEDHCDAKLRQKWIIVFGAVGLFSCIVLGMFCRKYCCSRGSRRRQRVSRYKVYAADNNVVNMVEHFYEEDGEFDTIE